MEKVGVTSGWGRRGKGGERVEWVSDWIAKVEGRRRKEESMGGVAIDLSILTKKTLLFFFARGSKKEKEGGVRGRSRTLHIKQKNNSVG